MSIIKGTNQIVAGFGGTKRSIGEVYFSQSALATDNSGALPLFTGETIASANTIYPEFYNWVLAHTELQCTSAEYESALSTYGECAKYVIGGGSLRLPKLSNYIKAANTSEGITQTNAGLPNITGQVEIYIRAQKGRGAFSTPSDSAANATEVGRVTLNDEGTTAFFDASKSNAIYGSSDTVQPAHTTLYPWVVAYTAAVPASTTQAAEFQQGLSGKADTNLGNLSTAGKDLASGLGMPSDRYTEFAVGASDAIYTMPFNGYVSIVFNTTSNFSYCHLYSTTTNSGVTLTYYASGLNGLKMMLPVKKGKTFTISYSGLTFTDNRLLKAEGAE